MRRSKLHYTASSHLWVAVSSQPVHETATYKCDDTRGCIMQFWPPDYEHMCSKHVEAWNKLIVKQKFCASRWLITEINSAWKEENKKIQARSLDPFCSRTGDWTPVTIDDTYWYVHYVVTTLVMLIGITRMPMLYFLKNCFGNSHFWLQPFYGSVSINLNFMHSNKKWE